MNINDEELQNKIERGLNADGDNQDAQAYQKVFDALSNEPNIRISPTFADKIISRVVEKNQKSANRDFFWFGVGLFFLLIAFVAALAMTAPKFDLGFLKGMSAYAGLFVFGTAILIAFHWLDKRILNKPANSDTVSM